MNLNTYVLDPALNVAIDTVGPHCDVHVRMVARTGHRSYLGWLGIYNRETRQWFDTALTGYQGTRPHTLGQAAITAALAVVQS